MVPLPHMRRRLRVDDPIRMSVLARRFAPARCVVLDDGVRVPLAPDGGLPPRRASSPTTATIIEAGAA